jgi:hypothetical protein
MRRTPSVPLAGEAGRSATNSRASIRLRVSNNITIEGSTVFGETPTRLPRVSIPPTRSSRPPSLGEVFLAPLHGFFLRRVLASLESRLRVFPGVLRLRTVGPAPPTTCSGHGDLLVRRTGPARPAGMDRHTSRPSARGSHRPHAFRSRSDSEPASRDEPVDQATCRARRGQSDVHSHVRSVDARDRTTSCQTLS